MTVGVLELLPGEGEGLERPGEGLTLEVAWRGPYVDLERPVEGLTLEVAWRGPYVGAGNSLCK